MTMEARSTRRLMVLGACALLTGLPGPATAHQHCDEKRVAALARKVGGAASRIKDNLARDWDRADKTSTRYVVINDLMILQHRAVALEGLIRAGQGRDKTEPVYRRMLSAVEHARQDSQQFPEIAAQQKHIDTAEAALQELADCYGPPVEAGAEPSP